MGLSTKALMRMIRAGFFPDQQPGTAFGAVQLRERSGQWEFCSVLLGIDPCEIAFLAFHYRPVRYQKLPFDGYTVYFTMFFSV